MALGSLDGVFKTVRGRKAVIGQTAIWGNVRGHYSEVVADFGYPLSFDVGLELTPDELGALRGEYGLEGE